MFGARLPSAAAVAACALSSLPFALCTPAAAAPGPSPPRAGQLGPDPAASKPATPLRWGVLGAANIAPKFIGGFGANSSLCAVGSRDVERAARFAKAHGGPTTIPYGSYQQVLDDPTVNAVYVPLPNDQHVPWTLAAIAAGKHVMVEKPLGITAEEVNAVKQAAEARGVYVAEAMLPLFHPQLKVCVCVDECVFVCVCGVRRG